MNLTNEDVQEILQLLDQLPLDELELSTDRFHLRLRRSGGQGWTQSLRVVAPPQPMGQTGPDPSTAEESAPIGADIPPGGSTGATTDLEGRFAVRAPLLGTFYRAPRPGADPYVDVGDPVEEDTVIGIIETMKLMNSVYAGVRGTVVDIRKPNAEFTDKDEILMVVEPDPS